MKKAIIGLMLFLALSGFALDVGGEFRIGHDTGSPLAFTHILIELIQEPFILYGGWRTWMEFSSLFDYKYPFRDIYEIGIKVGWENWFVDLNHFCNHPVWVKQLNEEWLDNMWGEALTTVSIGVRW